MMDPMANLTGDPSSTPGAIGDSSTGGEGKDVFDLNALNKNMKSMDRIQSYMGIICGCCSGILGLTNRSGIVFFLVAHMTVSLSILGIKMKFDLKTYSRTSMVSFLFSGLQTCFMSFMLFWTLFYGLVYLF